jgi:alkylhydroperoxidase/carboxymuconolactone decarboxylase family protein YurZ
MSDTYPRIEPLRAPSAEVQQILAKTLHHNGAPLNAALVLAHHPRLLKRFMLFAGVFLSHSLLPDRDRELITLRSAYRCRVHYYFAHHIESALAAGLTPAEVLATADESYEWHGNDQLLIAAADEMAVTAQLSDVTWTPLSAVYSPAQLEEIVLLPGFYRMMAGFINTVGVELEPGVADWPSEGGAVGEADPSGAG